MNPGTDLIIWPNTGGDEQKWSRFVYPGDPITTDTLIEGQPFWTTSRFQNQKSGLCITTDGVAGHSLFQEPCDPSNKHQIWQQSNYYYVVPDGRRFQDSHNGVGYFNPESGLWWDLEGASANDGTRVIGWYSNTGSNQQWPTLNGFTIGISTSRPIINDDDSVLQYTGAWGVSSNRPPGFNDYKADVYYTTVGGAFVDYKFYGRSITYYGEISLDCGDVDVYIDGNFQRTVSAYQSGVHNYGGQPLFSTSGLSVGEHTIRLVKRSGAYMLVDAFTAQP